MLGACQPHSQTHEKAERAATGRTGEPQGQGGCRLWSPSGGGSAPSCGHTGLQPVPPAPQGGVCGDSTPSVIWWLVVLGQEAGLYWSLVFSSFI